VWEFPRLGIKAGPLLDSDRDGTGIDPAESIMSAGEFGRKLGIGARVAGRIARQHVEGSGNPAAATASPRARPAYPPELAAKAREIKSQAPRITRAAGRGIGGFLRPFGRVGGILWLEVTGFFFGLFALWFALDLWKARLSYAHGPGHQRFLIAVALTALFGYLSVSAFWRARKK
jgi:hypothetical protein